MQTHKKDRLDSIQVVRGLAAMLVVLYHASALYILRFGYDLKPFFWWGYSGVDIFFVLSGFIITYSVLENPKLTQGEFLARRLLRIYPVYWVAIVGILALGFVSQRMGIGDSSTISKVNDTTIVSFLGTFLLIPKSSEIILVAWTLSYEMTFYLLFALLYFKSQRLFFAVMGLWAFMCLLAGYYFHADFNGTHNPLIFMLNPIMIEFLLGCLIAYIVTTKRNFHPLCYAFFVFGILCYALNVRFNIGLQNIVTINQTTRFIIYGIPSFIIILSVIYLPITWPKILKFLGDASYSIYLFHYPIMGVLAKILILFHLPVNNVGGFVLLVSSTALICCLIYIFIEKPILTYGKQVIKARKMRLAYG